MGFAGLLLTVSAAFAANKCGAYRITDSGRRLVALEPAKQYKSLNGMQEWNGGMVCLPFTHYRQYFPLYPE